MKFVQAKWYRRGRPGPILGLTIHSMEAPEKGGTAESTAQYFTIVKRPASAHYCIDSDSEIGCVKDGDTAYHAPPASRSHIGLEHAGYARQTAAEWHDPYSWAMLRRSSVLAARLCKQYGIPVRFIDAAQMKAGNMRGITTHKQVSDAFHESDHWDPGAGFPMGEYVAMVSKGIHLVPPPAPAGVMKRGDSGKGVEFYQGMLNILAKQRINARGKSGGAKLKIDGKFGDATEEATRELQRFGSAMAKLSRGKPIPVTGVADKQVTAIIAYWVPIVLKSAKK